MHFKRSAGINSYLKKNEESDQEYSNSTKTKRRTVSVVERDIERGRKKEREKEEEEDEEEGEEKGTRFSNEIRNCARNGTSAIQARSEDRREGKSQVEKLARW